MKKDNFWHYSFDIPSETKNVQIPEDNQIEVPENAVLQYQYSECSPTLICPTAHTWHFIGPQGYSGTSENIGVSGNSGVSGKVGISGKSGFPFSKNSNSMLLE